MNTIPVESLSDEQILTLADLQMDSALQIEMSDLLADNREAMLTDEQRMRLNELIEIYGEGMLRKSEALRVAVERGLKSPLH